MRYIQHRSGGVAACSVHVVKESFAVARRLQLLQAKHEMRYVQHRSGGDRATCFFTWYTNHAADPKTLGGQHCAAVSAIRTSYT